MREVRSGSAASRIVVFFEKPKSRKKQKQKEHKSADVRFVAKSGNLVQVCDVEPRLWPWLNEKTCITRVTWLNVTYTYIYVLFEVKSR